MLGREVVVKVLCASESILVLKKAVQREASRLQSTAWNGRKKCTEVTKLELDGISFLTFFL